MPIDVLQIRMGAQASLDIVRKKDERIYLIVFAERGVVQRRTILRLHFDDAQRLARFIIDEDGNWIEAMKKAIEEEVEAVPVETTEGEDTDVFPTGD